MSDTLLESAFQRQWFGKYRAIVTDNADPDNLGRVRVRVPALGDVELGWALPCVPYAGDKVGFYMIPAPDARVWVEFEGGDPARPIWVGGYWPSGQMIEDAKPEQKIIKTVAHTITLDDSDGSERIEIKHKSGTTILVDSSTLTITHSDGATVTIDASSTTIDSNGPQITLDTSGVMLENGSQKITIGAGSVTVNGTSLEIL